MIMPGILQVLVVSPCSNFSVGAMSEQLLIWHGKIPKNKKL
jgi:hypothetical protein